MSNLDGLPKANMSGSRCPILAAYPHMASLPIPHGLPNTALPAASCPVLSSPASAIAAGAARAQANHTQTAFAPSSSSASSTSSAPARKGATPPAPGSPFSFPSPSPSPIPSPEKISLFNVMDDLLECVVVADANGTILRANSAAQTLFGYSSAELLGQNVAMLCEPEIARIHQRFLDRYLSTRRPVVIGTAGRDVRGQHKNGALIPLRLSVAETRHMGHTLFIAQLHDLRPIKQREEELRVFSQLNKTVAERTSAEIHERIMHSVAHELRNPLQTISGSLFQLRTSLANLSNSDSELLSDIQTAIVRCCSVLDNAVLVCNYQTRKLTQDPSFERADVRDSLESVRQQLRFYTTAPIRVEVDSSVPQEAFFNVTHTRQILKYAMANAMKHTLHGEMVLRASVVPNVRARKTDLSPSDSANQDLLRLEIQYCCHLGSRSSFADSAAWLFPVSAKLTEATSFSDPDLPVPPLSTKSTRVDSSRPASALPSPSSDSDSSENSSPSITPLSDCVGSSADSNSVASQPLTPAALPVVPVSLASVSSAPRASSTQPQPLSSTTAPAITSTNPPALASYHIHQKTQRATSDSAGIVSDFVSRCPHMDAAYVPRGSATDSPTADADSEMRGRTERMLEMTNQLVAAMGGTCALQILGCRDLEVDPAVQSHLTPTSCLANNHRVVHFTDKRFWFTVPFNYTARTVTEEERQSSSLVEAVSRLLSLGAQEKKDSITAHAPPASAFRLSTFNSDGTTSAVSLTSALAVASLQDTKLNKRVLFVDDEVTIGKMAARYLQKLGCTHTVLTDGDQVMAELERKQYDIVLLDIVMPRLNGEDACALIRAKYPELPVIAATANTSAQDQTRYRQVGFNGCLAKPYSINDMRAAIVKWTSDMELYGNEFIVPNGLKHSGSAPSIQPQPVKS